MHHHHQDVYRHQVSANLNEIACNSGLANQHYMSPLDLQNHHQFHYNTESWSSLCKNGLMDINKSDPLKEMEGRFLV